jgi:ATP-dependent DNA ligase
MKFYKSNLKHPGFPELRGSLSGIKFPAMAELKIDGEFNYICITKEKAFLINKYGTVREDFPELNHIRKVLGDNEVFLTCEVYWDNGKAGKLYDLLSHKKDDNIKLAILDVLDVNNRSLRNSPYIERREVLAELKLEGWAPHCWVVANKEQATQRFQEVVDNGWEGIVVKNLESTFITGPCSWVKMKMKDRTDYAVQLIDKTKERIEIATVGPNGEAVFVGVKAPNKYKKHIEVGDMVTIEHQGVLASGSLRHPVLIPKKGW